MSTLAELRRLGVLSDVDIELARALAELAGEGDPAVLLGVAFASWAIQSGHTCAELARIAERSWQDEAGEALVGIGLPRPDAWTASLAASALVANGEVSEAKPLVLTRGRLYLARYFAYEERLARSLKARIGPSGEPLDGPALRATLERLFPSGTPGVAGQRLAALLAVLARFSVISGGPGTGKTFTVAKILYLLCDQAHVGARPAPRILLLAPTGKAAQRLGEAIGASLAAIAGDPAVSEKIPTAASTLHRALGYQPRTPTRFRHDARHPLPFDVVVVDEASMVDLALMAKLVDAVPPAARLILLGDKDQLASVEAGSILADVYAGHAAGFSSNLAQRVISLTGDVLPTLNERVEPSLADGMVELSYSHRFREGGGIAELARAVNAGDAQRALAVLKEAANVELLPLPDAGRLERALGPLVLQKFGDLGGAPPSDKLRLLDGFRILCCHRRGPFGAETLNGWVTSELRRQGRLDARGDFYDGRPVIVSANDYEIELFNGDVGVLASGDGSSSRADGAFEPRAERPLSAYFPDRAGGLRQVPLGRLPPHETAFAMSVHKSQGSEFDEVALLLSSRASPILTRELVYTAVTRARSRVRIFGSADVLTAAIEARVQRASGLRERLWGTE